MSNYEINNPMLTPPKQTDICISSDSLALKKLQQVYDDLKREFTEYKCSHIATRKLYLTEMATKNSNLHAKTAQIENLTNQVQILESELITEKNLNKKTAVSNSKSNALNSRALFDLQATCNHLQKAVNKQNIIINKLQSINLTFPLDIHKLTLELREKEKTINKFISSLDTTNNTLPTLQINSNAKYTANQQKSSTIQIKKRIHFSDSSSPNLERKFIVRNNCFAQHRRSRSFEMLNDIEDQELVSRCRTNEIFDAPFELDSLL